MCQWRGLPILGYFFPTTDWNVHANRYVDEFSSSTVNIHSELYLLQQQNDKALAEKFHPQPEITILALVQWHVCAQIPKVLLKGTVFVFPGVAEQPFVCSLQCSAEFGRWVELCLLEASPYRKTMAWKDGLKIPRAVTNVLWYREVTGEKKSSCIILVSMQIRCLMFCLDDSVAVIFLSINKVKIYVQLNNRSKNKKNFEGQVMD